jgi:hypothetical protein
MIVWVRKYDRPMLTINIGGVITRDYTDHPNSSAIQVQLTIINTGRQSTYVNKWDSSLKITGKTIDTRQLFGQPLAPGSVNEPEISDLEFPPGKPVRGWLFFALPGTPHDELMKYFDCKGHSWSDISVTIFAWDSKTENQWEGTKPLADLYHELCKSLGNPKQP